MGIGIVTPSPFRSDRQEPGGPHPNDSGCLLQGHIAHPGTRAQRAWVARAARRVPPNLGASAGPQQPRLCVGQQPNQSGFDQTSMRMTRPIPAARSTVTSACLVAVFLAGCAAPPESRTTQSKIAEILDTYHAQYRFDGVALVAKGDSILYEGGVGWADVGLDIPNTPATRFRVASITKVLTSILILQLVDEGVVGLDAPIGEYVAGLRPDLGTQITIRHLLTHTSSLPREYLPADADPRRDYRLADLVDAVNRSAPSALTPGEEVSYSNGGFVLLAAAIEAGTGLRYRDALSARIFEPVGMTDSGTEEGAAFVVPGLARGYRLRLGTYIHADRGGGSVVRGNGGIYSTARDLLRLDRALRNGELLSARSHSFMFTKGAGPFAITWQVGEAPDGYPAGLGRLAWARGANSGGFRTQWMTQLEGDITIILLSNLDFAPRHDITARIFRVLSGAPADLPQTPLSILVLDAMQEEGDSEALALISSKEISEEDRSGAINELVELGHHRIRAQEPESAIPLFALADLTYPDNSGIIVSLAYAHLESGHWAQARQLAEKALSLAPGDPDAMMVLAEARPH